MDGVWEEYGGGGAEGVVVFNRGKIVSAPAVQGGWGGVRKSSYSRSSIART